MEGICRAAPLLGATVCAGGCQVLNSRHSGCLVLVVLLLLLLLLWQEESRVRDEQAAKMLADRRRTWCSVVRKVSNVLAPSLALVGGMMGLASGANRTRSQQCRWAGTWSLVPIQEGASAGVCV